MTPPVRILFLCTGNSARSQMAEGFARHLGKGRLDAFSAGTEPRPLNPAAVREMAALGIDISQQQSKHMERYADDSFDFVITVCDRLTQENCPAMRSTKEHIRWSIDDPTTAAPGSAAEQRLFRRIGAELRQRISLLILSNRVHDERGQPDGQ